MAHLITCPECNKQLQVPDDLFGKNVQCPECQHRFTAEAPDLEVITAAPPKPGSLPVPTRKSTASSKKDGDTNGSKRRRKEDDDDDDYDERPSRRRRRPNYGTPHRAGLILAFGILALVSGLGIIFGPLAWMMGNTDLSEMQAGNMDPEGESMTQTGRILGMIATILSIVGLVICCGYFFLVFGLIFAGAANQQQRNFPQQRR